MKKPGQWIATFGPSMRVSRVQVEPSPALDLVEVRTVNLSDELTNVFFFDRLEAARLKEELGTALERLDQAAVDAARPRFVPVYTCADMTVWTVEDQETHQLVGPTWRGGNAAKAAGDWAANLNRENTEGNHLRTVAAGP